MSTQPDAKTSILSTLLGSVKKTATSAANNTQAFATQYASRDASTTASTVPGWLLPLAIALAVGVVLVKFVLPKMKGKSSAIKFGSRAVRK